MKTSKLFITSLLAASAMCATAFATDVPTGTETVTTTLEATNTIAEGGSLVHNSSTPLTSMSGTTFTITSVDTTSDFAWLGTGVTDDSNQRNKNFDFSGVTLAGSGDLGIVGTTGSGSSTFTVSLSALNAATSFSGKLTILNQYARPTTVNIGGTTLQNAEFVFGAEIATADGYRYGSGDGNYTLNLSSAASLAGISGTSAKASRESVTVTTAGAVLTLAGAGAYEFYGAVGTSTKAVGISKTGSGSQTLGGTNYLGAVTVSGGTLKLAGTTNISGAVSVSNGTLDVSSGTHTLADTLTTGENAVLELGAVTADSAVLSAIGDVTLSQSTIFRIDSYVAGAQLVSSSGTLTAAGVTSGEVSGMGVANLYIGGYLANQRGNATFSVSDSGVLTLSYTEGANYSLTWNGGDSGVWKANGTGWTTTDTTGEVTFQHGDFVTFGEGTDNNVTIADNLKVGTLTTSAATTLSVADDSAATVSASTLSLGANLTLNGGVTLAVTTFASSIEQNSTVDYSNLSGTGTLSLGLRNDNGLGFNLSNFEGTIRVEASSGETRGRLQLNTSALKNTAKIVVASTGDLVFHGTGTNISNAVTFEDSSSVYVNENKTGALSGSVTATSGTLTKAGAGDLTFSGTSNINALSISSGSVIYSAGTHTVGSISASGKTLTVNGGSLTISGAAASTIGTLAVNGAVEVGGASNTTITTLSGTGTLTKNGAGTLTLTPANFSLASLKVGAGTVAFGGLSSSSFGASTTIEVSNGGNVDFSLSNKDDKTFSGTLVLKNGGKITKKDGSLVLGDVLLGETSTDTVYLLGNWGKGGTKITGALSGAATVYLANAGNMNGDASLGNTDGERFTISGSDNSYSGTLIVGKQNASTTSATQKTILIVGSETALKNAKVNLALGDKSAMWLGASSVTISGLEGTANSTVALNSDDSSITDSTLRVNQTANTTFAGTLAAGIALLKDGTGTLTLSGDNSANTSGVEIAKGVVVATNAAALGAAANAVRISGGQLKVSNVTLNQTAITVVLGEAYKTTTALVGENGGAFSGAVAVEATDLDALGLVAEVANEYSIWDASLETSGATLELSDAFRTLLADAGWTSSISGGTLTISAIPEPGMFGLLAGLGALALAGTRRRRRKA